MKIFLLTGCNVCTFGAVCSGLGALLAALLSWIFGLDVKANVIMGAAFGLAGGPIFFMLVGGEFETGPVVSVRPAGSDAEPGP